VYFNVNFNVFFKIKKVHLLVSELYIYQNARCNDKNKNFLDVSVSVLSCSVPHSAESYSEVNTAHDTERKMKNKVRIRTAAAGFIFLASKNTKMVEW
jgi:hypothetical protein